MKLTSLRLFGFKTFAEATTVVFEPGITALVGPNGSGKSNLVDAFRWVLGEHSPRNLRSTKTEDVIFVGNDRRKPLGMAEVSVTFDNSDGQLGVDYREVQVTRRAYRAGESEFFINRNAVRLRDVVELFMGTGLGPGSYAIVSQGQIDAFLSEKPTERRSLFEETAGIGKFLARKAESLRRLEQTETNAIRVSDLLAEINARIPELETQVRRAKRYRRATLRLRDLEILSYLRASASRRAEREALGGELERREAEQAAAAARAATLEADLATVRSQLYAQELALEQHRAQAQSDRATLADLDAQIAALTARRDALETHAQATTGDRVRTGDERSALDASLAELERDIAPQSAHLEVQNEAERAAGAALAAARGQLEGVFAQLRDVEAAAAAQAATDADRRAQLTAARLELDRLEAERAELGERAQVHAAAIAEAAREIEAASVERSALEAQAAAAAARLAQADTRVAEAVQRLAEAQAELRNATSEAASAEARLHTLEELEANLEGHVPGTRAVLEEGVAGRLHGIVGVVSSLVRVDEKYARALDIAFGTALSNIVTVTSEDAERAIAYLASRELGRATFLPLDTLGSRTGRERGAVPSVDGALAYAHALVETQPEYAGIVAFLVGRTLVVESLRVGIHLVRNTGFRDSVVTLDGDQISGGGAMTGGRYKRERAILSRAAQLRSLRAALPDLRESLSAAELRATAAAEESTQAQAERDAAARAQGTLAIAVRDVQARLEAATLERERRQAERAEALERSEQRSALARSARERIAVLEGPVETHDHAATRQRLEAELAGARTEIARTGVEFERVAGEVGAARESLAGRIAQRDAERVRLQMLDAERDRAETAREELHAEIGDVATRMERTRTQRDGAKHRVDEVERAGEQARAQRDELNARSGALEGDGRLAREAEREAAHTLEVARLRRAEIDAELNMLAANFAQNPATAQECEDVEARLAKEQGDASAEILRLRDDLARLSNVNLNAEAERDELGERETFLRTQLEDLARARETLLESIAAIEQSSQVQFNATFAAVEKAFERTFARLFPGGAAKMWQTNPESLAETGIEIAVQPPGKKMTSLAALSGGERAMTAAALIFALIAVRPSPFYLLDEVDAALDDANIERFSSMVREVAGEAQLVLVTHNKKTMELASRMHGVTMAEPGVSSIISADLETAGQPGVVRALAG